jgi:hypothetical protein
MDPPRKRLGTRFAVNSTAGHLPIGNAGNSKGRLPVKPPAQPPPPEPMDITFGSPMGSDFGGSFLKQIEKLEQEHEACMGKVVMGQKYHLANSDQKQSQPTKQSKKTTPKNISKSDSVARKRGTPHRQAKAKESTPPQCKNATRNFNSGNCAEPGFKATKIQKTNESERKIAKTPKVLATKTSLTKNDVRSPSFVHGKHGFIPDDSFDINEMSLMSIDSPLLVSTPVESKVPVLRPRQDNAAFLKHGDVHQNDDHSTSNKSKNRSDGDDRNRKKNNLFALLSVSNESPKQMDKEDNIYCVETQSPDGDDLYTKRMKRDNPGNEEIVTKNMGDRGIKVGGNKDSGVGEKLAFFTPEPGGRPKQSGSKSRGPLRDDVVQRLDFKTDESESRKRLEAMEATDDKKRQDDKDNSQGTFNIFFVLGLLYSSCFKILD